MLRGLFTKFRAKICVISDRNFRANFRFLGDDQRMTFLEGIDVEECQKIFILRHLVARDFAVDDASEYGCHMKICLLIASLLVVAYRLFEVP